MSLTEEINTLKAQAAGRTPDEITKIMQGTMAKIARTGVAQKALRAGDVAPAFSLPDAHGKTVSSAELLTRGPLVIRFYRGGWCPYCNLELRALQRALPQIEALGAHLVAISPQLPDDSLTTAEKNELSFAVLSDINNRVAQQFGLVYSLPEELRQVYRGFGIDLEKTNGNADWELPLAATYVVDADGRILQAFVDVDYTRRLEPADIIRTLENRRTG